MAKIWALMGSECSVGIMEIVSAFIRSSGWRELVSSQHGRQCGLVGFSSEKFRKI
jgi:hypothetical protein